MPDSTHLRGLDRFSRLFELIRQSDVALAVQPRVRAGNKTPSFPRDEQQAFIADAVGSLKRSKSQNAIF